MGMNAESLGTKLHDVNNKINLSSCPLHRGMWRFCHLLSRIGQNEAALKREPENDKRQTVQGERRVAREGSLPAEQ